jgi:hypothetical protein
MSGVTVTRVTMNVVMGMPIGMRMTGMAMFTMAVIIWMGMGVHRHHSTRLGETAQPFPALITQYDTLPLRID